MLPGLTSAILGGEFGIRFVGGAVAGELGSVSATTTLPLNSGLSGGISGSVQDGDLVIAVLAVGSDTNRSLSITDGTNDYTLIGSELYSNGSDRFDANLRVAYKFVSGDTATTFGPSGASDDYKATAVYCFRGVDQATPLDVTVTTATGTGTVLANPPSITPSTPGAFIVSVGAGAHGDNTPQTFSSSDLTDFLSVGSSGTGDQHITLGIGQKDDWLSGAFNPAVFTFSTSDSALRSWAAITIALRPA